MALLAGVNGAQALSGGRGSDWALADDLLENSARLALEVDQDRLPRGNIHDPEDEELSDQLDRLVGGPRPTTRCPHRPVRQELVERGDGAGLPSTPSGECVHWAWRLLKLEGGPHHRHLRCVDQASNAIQGGVTLAHQPFKRFLDEFERAETRLAALLGSVPLPLALLVDIAQRTFEAWCRLPNQLVSLAT